MSKIISSVKALILHNNKYLILKETLHKGDVWDVPGGKIQYGESPKEALKREVKEELCLDIEIIKSVGVFYFISQIHKDQVICHTFLCKVKGELKLDISKNPAVEENIIETRWMTAKELLSSNEVLLSESLKELLIENNI